MTSCFARCRTCESRSLMGLTSRPVPPVAVRLLISGTMSGPLAPPGFGPTCRRLEFETAEFSRFNGELFARHNVC